MTGSPVAQLRSGPNGPPLGSGSLNLLVGQGEKVAYGVVDSQARLVSSITQIGFSVYTTGENSARGNPNMPGIGIEIDPNLEPASTTGFSTLGSSPTTPPRTSGRPSTRRLRRPGSGS